MIEIESLGVLLGKSIMIAYFGRIMSKPSNNCIVVKLGTQVVVGEAGLAISRLENIVEEVANLSKENKVVLVSSGAVGLGQKALRLDASLELSQKQACAAVGQSIL